MCCVHLKTIQRLPQYLLRVRILAIPQQLLHSPHKLPIEVPCERRAGIIGKDADQHDRIVLDIRLRAPFFRQEASDLLRRSGGGGWGGFGGFDDDGEVKHFLAAVAVRAGFAEASDAADGVGFGGVDRCEFGGGCVVVACEVC